MLSQAVTHSFQWTCTEHLSWVRHYAISDICSRAIKMIFKNELLSSRSLQSAESVHIDIFEVQCEKCLRWDMHDHDFKEGYLTLYLALNAQNLLQIMSAESTEGRYGSWELDMERAMKGPAVWAACTKTGQQRHRGIQCDQCIWSIRRKKWSRRGWKGQILKDLYSLIKMWPYPVEHVGSHWANSAVFSV